MGAVTALLYTSKHDNRIAGLILDSPFSNLKELAYELIQKKTNLPGFVTGIIFSYL